MIKLITNLAFEFSNQNIFIEGIIAFILNYNEIGTGYSTWLFNPQVCSLCNVTYNTYPCIFIISLYELHICDLTLEKLPKSLDRTHVEV